MKETDENCHKNFETFDIENKIKKEVGEELPEKKLSYYQNQKDSN